jgi:hypothetical protein
MLKIILQHWIQIVLGAAGLVLALGVIWNKILHPVIKFVGLLDVMRPLLQEFVKVFRDRPEAFNILGEIVTAFPAVSGSSLPDVIKRIDQGIETSRIAADVLKVGLEADRKLAQRDREELRSLLLHVDRVAVKVDEGVATSLRNEEKVTHVAEDLAASHRRADESPGESSGAAADAAMRNGK